MPFRVALLPLIVALAATLRFAVAEDASILNTNYMIIKPFSAVDFLSHKARGGLPYDLPDVPDNDPTIHGGQLHLENFPRVSSDRIDLPVQIPPYGWTALGRPPGAKGYRYRGRGTANDPCGLILVKPSKVRIKCAGIRGLAGITPPFREAGALALYLGSGKRYCAQVVVQNATENDLTAFIGRNQVGFGGCYASPSGAFLE